VHLLLPPRPTTPLVLLLLLQRPTRVVVAFSHIRMQDVKSQDVHLTAKQLAPPEPGEQLAPFHEELSRFKLLFISTSRHPQTVGTSRHPQTIRTPRHPQTIGTSRHRYQSQSHFAIALELAYRHYHFSMADRAASNKEFQNRGFQQGIPTTAMTPLASPALIPASAHRQVAPPCTPLVRELHLASQLHSRFGSPPSASQLSLRSLWVSCSSPQLSPRFSVALKCRRSLHVSSARCGTVWRKFGNFVPIVFPDEPGWPLSHYTC
jgi:hypothetical protein